MSRRACLLAFALVVETLPLHQAQSASPQEERGRYLVTVMGCGDCHTPGYFLGHPDMNRQLSGSDVGFGIPGVGVAVGPNLTPDEVTGLGRWTDGQIVAAFTAGVAPGGRKLSPIMPYQDFAHLTQTDALAIVAYLRTIPAVHNQVPGPFGPADTPTVMVMTVLPGEAYAALPKPKQ